jgi:hypothetical protein
MLEVLKTQTHSSTRFRNRRIFVENLLLRNEGGQLGLGHTKDRQCPTLITELTGHNIVQVGHRNTHLFRNLRLPSKLEVIFARIS